MTAEGTFAFTLFFLFLAHHLLKHSLFMNICCLLMIYLFFLNFALSQSTAATVNLRAYFVQLQNEDRRKAYKCR